jgi:hypothetical protein
MAAVRSFSPLSDLSTLLFRVSVLACLRLPPIQASVSVGVMITSYMAHQRFQPFLRLVSLEQAAVTTANPVAAVREESSRKPLANRTSRRARDPEARVALVVKPTRRGSAALVARKWVTVAFVSVDYNHFESAFLICSVSFLPLPMSLPSL